jgi:uncharacterized protein YkwD
MDSAAQVSQWSATVNMAWMRAWGSAPLAAVLLFSSGCVTFDEPPLRVSVTQQSWTSDSTRSAPRQVRTVTAYSAPRGLVKVSLPEVRRGIIERTNEHRAARLLPALRRDPRLDSAAQGFAEHMARVGRFGHKADGRRAAERAKAAGYGPRVWENIAYYGSCGMRTGELSRYFFDTWMRSKPHAANVESRGPRDIGVGVAEGPEGCKWYAVMLLGEAR